MNLYAGADKAIQEMNRKNLKLFRKLRLAKWDEINVIRAVNEVYEQSAQTAKRKFFEVAAEAYIVALYELGISPERASRMADERITAVWMLKLLDEPDRVTLYEFNAETERKKQRLIEALAVAANRNAEVGKAMRYWSQQIAQYTDNCVFDARLDAFRDAGIRKVEWITQEDERVCEECDEKNHKVFDIDKVPPPPHWHCRCRLKPVIG